MQDQGDRCKGSARSIEGYSIYDGLVACAEHLERFGGHDAAAGLSLHRDRIDRFTEAFVAHANARIEVEQQTPFVRVDCDAGLIELDLETVREIGRLSPFGRANPRPKLRLRDLVLAEPPRTMGSEGKHLALRFRQDRDGRRRMIRGVWWNQGALAERLAAGARVDAVLEPKVNEFNGRITVEADLKDVLVHSSGAGGAA